MLAHLKTLGLEVSIISINHLDELENDIRQWHEQRFQSELFFNEYLGWFEYSSKNTLPEARSIIVVAIPDPETRFVFMWKKQSLPFTVPPTYLHWQRVNKRAEDALTSILKPAGYTIAPAKLPDKLIGCRSGLGQYGKNNICYLPNKGSFHRLACFYSDMPFTKDAWQESKVLSRCAKCEVCVKSCPTAALSSERFFINAEKCISYHNEKPGDIPFPDWINPAWHNCLVGCMICQKVCPENKMFLHNAREGVTFTQKETELLLKYKATDILPVELENKLKECDLVSLLDVIPRNLRVLLRL